MMSDTPHDLLERAFAYFHNQQFHDAYETLVQVTEHPQATPDVLTEAIECIEIIRPELERLAQLPDPGVAFAADFSPAPGSDAFFSSAPTEQDEPLVAMPVTAQLDAEPSDNAEEERYIGTATNLFNAAEVDPFEAADERGLEPISFDLAEKAASPPELADLQGYRATSATSTASAPDAFLGFSEQDLLYQRIAGLQAELAHDRLQIEDLQRQLLRATESADNFEMKVVDLQKELESKKLELVGLNHELAEVSREVLTTDRENTKLKLEVLRLGGSLDLMGLVSPPAHEIAAAKAQWGPLAAPRGSESAAETQQVNGASAEAKKIGGLEPHHLPPIANTGSAVTDKAEASADQPTTLTAPRANTRASDRKAPTSTGTKRPPVYRTVAEKPAPDRPRSLFSSVLPRATHPFESQAKSTATASFVGPAMPPGEGMAASETTSFTLRQAIPGKIVRTGMHRYQRPFNWLALFACIALMISPLLPWAFSGPEGTLLVGELAMRENGLAPTMISAEKWRLLVDLIWLLPAIGFVLLVWELLHWSQGYDGHFLLALLGLLALILTAAIFTASGPPAAFETFNATELTRHLGRFAAGWFTALAASGVLVVGGLFWPRSRRGRRRRHYPHVQRIGSASATANPTARAEPYANAEGPPSSANAVTAMELEQAVGPYADEADYDYSAPLTAERVAASASSASSASRTAMPRPYPLPSDKAGAHYYN